MKKNFIMFMSVIAFAMGVVSCNSRQTAATGTTTDEAAIEVVDTLLVEDTTGEVTDAVVEAEDSTDVE